MDDVRPVFLSEVFLDSPVDHEEMEATVREHARFVYRLAFAVLHNHHDAEDAAQETFVACGATGAICRAFGIANCGWRGSPGGWPWTDGANGRAPRSMNPPSVEWKLRVRIRAQSSA